MKVIRIICGAFGAFLTVNAICLVLTTNLNTGNLLAFALGIGLLGYGIFYEKIQSFCKNKIILFVKYGFFAVLATIMAFSVFLQMYGSVDKTDYDEGVLIVLGAAVHGETAGKPLANRLDEAVQYLNKNKTAVVVVSGGKGAQEKMSEAEVMANYLIDKGIDEKRIIKEDQSTSTYENFVFTKKILDEKFNGNYRITFITNEFHVFRAERLAKNAGFEDISHIGAPIPWYTLFPNCMRECLANVKLLIFGK